MKKIIALVLTTVMMIMCFGTAVSAKAGDVIGTALHTDIVVYINNFAIPSYIVNGQSVIVAEDLRNFGFDVIWDGVNRTLDIDRNSEIIPNDLMFVGKGYSTGAKCADILESDIVVYAADSRITSFALNGYTMIPVEELTMFGEINWNAGERTLKMQVNDLIDFTEIFSAKQPVSKRYYPGTSAPDFGWVTESACYAEEGEFHGYLINDSSKVQEYIDYIESLGWQFQINLQDNTGRWYLGYVNSRNRTGIGISELDGDVFIQVSTNMDGWNNTLDE